MKLSLHAMNTLNDCKYIDGHKKIFETLSQVYNHENDSAVYLNGICGFGSSSQEDSPREWLYESLEALASQCESHQCESQTTARPLTPLCINHGPFGVHFIDKLLGARVYFSAGQWYNEYIKSPIGELETVDFENHEAFACCREVVDAFLELGVKVPLFGMPTIASPLNIAVNLYGEEILVALMLEPEKAEHDLRIIADLQTKIHLWYKQRIPAEQLQCVVPWERLSPVGYGQICGCTTQLLSGGSYAEYVEKLDDTLLGLYDNGGMMHICGSHTQHINSFRQMKNLKSIQLNDRATDEFELYFNGLRDDQIIYVMPTINMPVEKILDISCGKRVVIQSAHLNWNSELN